MTDREWPRVSILIAGGRDTPAVRHTERSLRASDYAGELQVLTGPAGAPDLPVDAMNEHAAEASGPLLMVLPPGTTLDPRCIRRLVGRFNADDRLVAVSPRWRGADGHPLDENGHLSAHRAVRRLLAPGAGSAIESPFGMELDALGAMMVRTRSFFRVGGFDPSLAESPALNPDLARRLSAPEGGIEVETGAVAFTPRLPPGLHRLPGYPITRSPAGPGPRRADGRRRVLWLAAHLPDARRSGVDARHLELIEALEQLGFDVAGWAEHDGGGAPGDRRPGRWITPPPDARWRLPDAASPGRWLRELLGGVSWDFVVVAEPRLTGWVIPEIRQLAPGARVLVDLGAVRFPAAHEPQADFRVADAEPAALAAADGVIAATGQDASVLRERGLATAAFGAFGAAATGASGPDRDGGLLFVGDLLHRPNLEAVDWWLDAVAARVAARLGRPVPLRVVGAGSDARRASRNHPDKAEIAGWVPDLGRELDRARLLVVPLRVATGTGGRIATAVGRGLPVVATPAAAAVLSPPLRRVVEVGEGADGLADQITRLMGRDDQWEAARARITAAGLPGKQLEQIEELGDWMGALAPAGAQERPASRTPRRRRGRRRRLRAS